MSPAVDLDASADGTTVTLAPGHPLIVRLPEISTTGYRWTVDQSGGLQLEADDFLPGGTGVGGGGTRRLQWRTSMPGTHVLVLVQRRVWETQGEPHARFQLTVIVA